MSPMSLSHPAKRKAENENKRARQRQRIALSFLLSFLTFFFILSLLYLKETKIARFLPFVEKEKFLARKKIKSSQKNFKAAYVLNMFLRGFQRTKGKGRDSPLCRLFGEL